MKIIGIDIGGTKIRGVLWDGKKILRKVEFSTPKSLETFKNILKRILMTIGTSGSVKKIGVGVAGVIKNYTVISTTNIPYLKNYNFKNLLKTCLSGRQVENCKLKIDNDARCFARAEYEIGVGRGAKSVLFLTLGTGIGRAYVKNGKILNIKKFEYPEKWEKKYQKIHNKKALAKFLGEKLQILIIALNPKIVVIGGGVAEKKEYFKSIKNQLSPAGGGTKLGIKHSKLGKFTGAIGATMLFSTPH